MAQLSALQVAAAAYIGGFSGDDLVKAVQVAYGESSWNTTSANSCCYGLWQINKQAWPALFRKYKWDNPADNARMANIIFQKEASLLHPNGQWCSHGSPPNGCNPWQAYGNANYNSKANEAKMAVAQLKQQIGSGKHAEDILGSKRTDGATGDPALGGIAGPGPLSVPYMDAFNRVGKWITNPDNLTRIFKVIVGGIVIVVGGAMLMDKQVMSILPAGRVAKMVMKGGK